MADKLKKKPATPRTGQARPTDRDDALRLKLAGDPSHINAREDALLRQMMPEAHGRVVTSGLLAEAGRRGDDRVTLLIPEEAALLKARGGAGTVNPASGLLEFYSDNGADGQGDKGSEGDQGPGGSSGPGGQGVGPTGHGADSPAGPGHTDGADRSDFGLGYRAYDPTTMPSIESLLNTPSGYRAQGYEGLSMMQYSPPDTFGRLFETFRYGPPPSYKALGNVPGRYGVPTGRGPGMVGTALGMMTGNPMSMAMGLGMHFDQAMSPATRAASLAENQAIGAQNSTGQDRDSSTGLSLSEMLGSQTPGTASGSAGLLGNARPGQSSGSAVPAMEPAAGAGTALGLLGGTDSGAHTKSGLPQPVENLLMDYIWRGRQGTGFGW